jgi:hypothetical protein
MGKRRWARLERFEARFAQLGESFFVMYGDSYLPCDYAAVEKEFWRSGSWD